MRTTAPRPYEFDPQARPLRSRPLGPRLRALAAAIGVAALATPALATSFTVTLGTSIGANPVSDPTFAETTDAFDGSSGAGPASGNGTVFAGPGGTGAVLYAEATGPFTNFTSGITLFASGEMVIDDIVISRVGGSTGPEAVDVALAARFEGSVGPVSTNGSGDVSANAFASITLTNSNLASVTDPFDPASVSTPVAYNEILTTPFLTVQTDTPITATLFFTLGINASARSAVGSGEAGTSQITADFGSTLAFPVGAPVFDLPDGFTANSSDGLIVDNQFAVPEPGASLLVGLGVAGLGLAASRCIG